MDSYFLLGSRWNITCG